MSIEAKPMVNDSYGTTILPRVCDALRETVELRDTVWWVYKERLSVRIVHERYGAFEDVRTLDCLVWDSQAVFESGWIN